MTANAPSARMAVMLAPVAARPIYFFAAKTASVTVDEAALSFRERVVGGYAG
ncbi:MULTISPECIES: hypothetical protein [unclassified Rothia (in: high G+C Gram-positive bacteria)]|uniref:hypothetical protein n=1 Tax=unclassified Rothia (in: high G+C Gram-positive bacteria) TaxID=2689056 RepID=UPI00195DDA69|nr:MULTISPECIES: hypothetical protein [unclassified Rothia (in: high G+C Gram-positive bacteria)]MBM7052244.1 hypothetical protein [Rothia sp. ZJ1223]QRZ61341.1 hypothetical protein JR346_08915 [Rothia sp. ZJ932]